MPENLLQTIATIGAVIITAAGAYLTARLSSKAAERKTNADREIGAGQLALDIAMRLDGEVAELRTWRSRVLDWWPKHERWDAGIVTELERVDPGATRRLPERPEPPM